MIGTVKKTSSTLSFWELLITLFNDKRAVTLCGTAGTKCCLLDAFRVYQVTMRQARSDCPSLSRIESEFTIIIYIIYIYIYRSPSQRLNHYIMNHHHEPFPLCLFILNEPGG